MSNTRHPPAPTSRPLSASISVPAPAHTAQSLVARHPGGTRAVVATFVGANGGVAVVELGRRASAERIAGDGVRLLGAASDFLAQATDAQRGLVAAVDERFLSAAACSLAEVDAHKAGAARREITLGARKRGAKRAAEGLLTEGRARREVYAANLTAACGTDAAWRARIAGTVVAVSTPEELARSIEAMAAEGRALRDHLPKSGRPGFLTDAWLEGVTSYAASLRARDAAASGVVDAASAARGDLAWWQGASVWFLSTLVSVFGRANAADGTVPKMTPRQLRAVLQPHKTRKKAAKKGEAQPGDTAKKAEPAAPEKPAREG